MLKAMIKWFGIVLGTLFSVCHTHRALALENLALRQQLAVMKHRQPRPRSTDGDRLFRLVLSRLWGDWPTGAGKADIAAGQRSTPSFVA
jgi:hypothetical protein